MPVEEKMKSEDTKSEKFISYNLRIENNVMIWKNTVIQLSNIPFIQSFNGSQTVKKQVEVPDIKRTVVPAQWEDLWKENQTFKILVIASGIVFVLALMIRWMWFVFAGLLYAIFDTKIKAKTIKEEPTTRIDIKTDSVPTYYVRIFLSSGHDFKIYCRSATDRDRMYDTLTNIIENGGTSGQNTTFTVYGDINNVGNIVESTTGDIDQTF